MGDELHKLFLFEFLVHSVNYSNSTLKLDPDFLKGLGPTCVQFKGKNLPSLIVSEIDFCAKDAFNSNIVKFKSGKSSLFSLGDTIITDCEIRGEITVKRKLEGGSASNFYCLGRSPIILNNKFINVLNSPGITPMSQCVKLSLDLRNAINENVGTARILLRLTCFGTVIITEFQKNFEDSKGYLFKGDKIVPLEPEASGYGNVGRDNKYLNSQREIMRDQERSSQRHSITQPPMLLNANTIPPNYNMSQSFPQSQQGGQPGFNQMQPGFFQQQQQFPQMMQQCPPGCYPSQFPPQQQQQFPQQQQQFPMQQQQFPMQQQFPSQQQQFPNYPGGPGANQNCFPQQGFF